MSRSSRESTRQPRGEARRQSVLEAVLRVIARDGIRGVTHRAVAAEAGTSLRATTYYFSSKDDLLVQALAQYIEERLARVEEVGEVLTIDRPLAVGKAAELLAAFVMEELTPDQPRLVAEYELALEATRSRVLAEQYERFNVSLVDLLATLAEATGSRRPQLDAQLILAAVRGIELDALTWDYEDLSTRVHEQCRRLVHALFD